jgi:prepilin-type processing-associated H-X9-DG protein
MRREGQSPVSFMPSEGTICIMLDGRVAIVRSISPSGDDGTVLFVDGHVEKTDAWRFEQMLTDYVEKDNTLSSEALLRKLRTFLDDPRAIYLHDFNEYAFTIELNKIGSSIVVRYDSFPRLLNATDAQRKIWQLTEEGVGVHWPLIDEDISIPRLLGLDCP